MKPMTVNQILKEINYIRTGGSPEELRAAETLADYCRTFGAEEAHLESFEVQMAEILEVHLYADGVEIPAKAFKNCGNGDLEAEFVYLPNQDPVSLLNLEGKIVLIDTGVTHFVYQDLLDKGVAGIIHHSGNVNYRDNDIDQKELRAYVSKGRKIPVVSINTKDAVKLVRMNPEKIHMVIRQEESMGESHNVVASLPGTTDEWLVLTAHYDTTPLSQGAYDNMSGCIGLLSILEHMARKAPHRYGLRLVFCGSEERGLLGSKAYVAAHEAELEKIALCINLDMIGSIMGKFIACVTAEESLVNYVKYMACELGWSIHAYQDVYSSDSTPFADHGVPAISFARWAGNTIAPIHNRYDTAKVLTPEQILKDAEFITAFTGRMADAVICPVSRTIPDNMKEELDKYLLRKRK